MNKEEILKKWKHVFPNVDDENKRQWLSEYSEFIEQNKNFNYPCNDFVPQHESGDSFSPYTNLLPVAMKIASQTIGMDLVSIKPLSAPSLGGTPELNEEKYVNERRKLILDDIFNDEEIDFDKKDDETDFKKLDDIKKDFMEGGGLLFFDYVYNSSGNTTPKNNE